MCIEQAKAVNIPSMTAYVVVRKEVTKGKTRYRGIYRYYFVTRMGVRRKAQIVTRMGVIREDKNWTSVANETGFHAFTSMQGAQAERNAWLAAAPDQKDEIVIVKCLMEKIYAKGRFYASKDMLRTYTVVKACYRTIVKEM